MQHLLQENIAQDLRKVNVMGQKTERELMLPENLTGKKKAAGKQTVFDLSGALTRGDCNDHKK